MGYQEEFERKGAIRRRAFLSIFLISIATLIGAFLWMTATPGSSHTGERQSPHDPDLADRLESHVGILAASPRNLQKIATVTNTIRFLQGELESHGYAVERQEVVSPADNLIVRVRAAENNAPTLVIGAHYDSFGASLGADDNASGVAALLELARLLKRLDGRISTELVLVFYANEEPPYFKTNAMGSLVHARSIDQPGQITGMISLETIGYFSDEPDSQNYPFPLSLRYPDTGNFVAFVGNIPSRNFLHQAIGKFRENARVPSVGGTAPFAVQGIDWSDHWAYSQQGIPAIMVTDTAPFRNPNYHLRSDTTDTLDYGKLALVVEGLHGMVIRLSNEPS